MGYKSEERVLRLNMDFVYLGTLLKLLMYTSTIL